MGRGDGTDDLAAFTEALKMRRIVLMLWENSTYCGHPYSEGRHTSRTTCFIYCTTDMRRSSAAEPGHRQQTCRSAWLHCDGATKRSTWRVLQPQGFFRCFLSLGLSENSNQASTKKPIATPVIAIHVPSFSILLPTPVSTRAGAPTSGTYAWVCPGDRSPPIARPPQPPRARLPSHESRA